MNLTPYLYTYLLGVAPVIELRGAIPAGYWLYDLGITWATVLGILGSLSLALVCLLSIPVAEYVVIRIPFLKKIWEFVLNKTRRKYSDKMKLWGEVFLIILVAIPLPGSGAFTGSLLAYLFGIPRLKAFGLISLGVVVSGLIVAALTLSGEGLWEAVSQLI